MVNSNSSLTFSLTLLCTLFLSSHQNDTPISRFQQYLRFDTTHPNPNYTPPVDFLISIAKTLNLKTQTFHFVPEKPVLLLTWQGSNPSLPSLIFNSHLDSVPVEPSKWSHPPFAAVKTVDGKIYARGAQDDKCIGIQYLEAIRNLKDKNFVPIRTVHVVFVPDEEIGGFTGAKLFVESNAFKELNVGFMLDEGQASINDEYRVFYADRQPWNLVIKANGQPGHGSKMFNNGALENLMKSVEVVMKFRENQFDVVKAGFADFSEVISVNPVYLKSGITSPTGFVMNMQPSEAEAGFNIRMPPIVDPDLLRKRIAEEWAPASRNMSFEISEVGVLRDINGQPLITAIDDSNPWWRVFKQAITAAGGKLAKPEILASTTDARYTRYLGIPALGFSPMISTPILLHEHNEHLQDEVFLKGIEVYEHIMSALSSFEEVSST